MKQKMIPFLFGVILVAGLLVAIAFFWRMSTNHKAFLVESGVLVWVASRVEMPGLSTSIYNVFEEGVTLTLQPSGKCLLEIDKEQFKVRWSIKDNEIRIRGKGIDSNGHVDQDVMSLYEIGRYRIILHKQPDASLLFTPDAAG